jgi:hypothetical protein
MGAIKKKTKVAGPLGGRENQISGRCKKRTGVVATRLESFQKLASERMHEMKIKPVATLEKKTKVGMGTKTNASDKRMHEMKTKPKQHL